MPMPWFRLYSEVLTDRKLAYVASVCGLPKVMVIGFWAGLLCLANDAPERGNLELAPGLPLDEMAIGEAVGTDGTTAGIILDSLIQVGMVSRADGHFAICKWQTRQFASDDVTPRVQKYREQKKRYGNVTPPAPCNTPDTDTEQIRADADAEKGAPATATFDPKLGEVHTAWQNARGGAVGHMDAEQITELATEYTPEWVLEAIREANRSKQDKLPSIKFVEVILQRWKREGFKAPFDAKKKREEALVKQTADEQAEAQDLKLRRWNMAHGIGDKDGRIPTSGTRQDENHALRRGDSNAPGAG